MKIHAVRIGIVSKALALLLAAGVVTGIAHANDAETVVTVAIGGSEAEPFANGAATYRVRPDQTKLEVEVEDLRHATAVAFSIDGVSLGTAAVSLGQANVEVESEDGAVPVLSANSKVIVTDASSGAIIAASGNVVIEDDDEGADDHEGSVEGDDEGDDNGGHSEAENEGDDEGDANGGHGEAEDEHEGDDSGHHGDGEDEGESEGDDSGHHGDGEDSGELELEFALTGTSLDPAATGKAELKNDNERRRIEVEVQGVTAASRISVLVDGVNVGTGPVREGEAEVKRDERDDYTIPVVTSASRVDVINSETGLILLSNVDIPVITEGEGSIDGEGSSEGEAPATDGVVLQQRLGPNGFYVPGESTVIEARLSYTGTERVLALSVEQTLPAGWTFVQALDNLGAFLNPRVGDSGTLTWAWIAVPRMPAVLRYEVFVPADAAGVQTVEGSVLYRRSGGAEYAVASLDAPAGEGFTKEFCHNTDANRDWQVELGEVLRMIQIYNVGSYHCEVESEDGFAPGDGDDSCGLHDADHLNPDGSVDMSELLRTVQFYNADDSAYKVDDNSEDGYAPGMFSLED